MTASTGYVVVWGCYCADAADRTERLPDRCPEHDRPRVCDPIQNTMPGGVRAGHECDIGGPNWAAHDTTRESMPAVDTKEAIDA